MGYDMSWEQEPAEVVAAEHAAFQGGKINTTEADRYLRLQEQAGSYFRLNIWGMGEARRVLIGTGMAWEAPPPTWPEDADDEATEAVRRTQVERPGIPLFKLSSNDHWLVTPDEIWSGLLLYEKFKETMPSFESALRQTDQRYILEFIEWMRGAAEHGGFRVD
jgi:hypothetical protein